MRNSERSRRTRNLCTSFSVRVFAGLAAIATTATALSACGTYGDPCLRTTDCGSGLVCVEGQCVVDLGDNPSDGAVVSDASASDAPGTNDASSPDANTDQGNTSTTDSAGSDAPRDTTPDGDSAETTSLDARIDSADAASDVAAPIDASDARTATDASSGTIDAASADVGADRDAGSVIDVTLDVVDAAG